MLSIFTRIPTLETNRLTMRKILPSDCADMYNYSCLPETSRYLLWSPHANPRYTKKYLSFIQSAYRNETFYDFALVDKASGKMIGTCGFVRFDTANDSAEVGYVFNPSYRDQGYATEALCAVLDFGFSKLGLHRIEARFMKDNLASRRVMEKCGMYFEGICRDMLIIKGKYEDIGICAAIAPHTK